MGIRNGDQGAELTDGSEVNMIYLTNSYKLQCSNNHQVGGFAMITHRYENCR